MKNHLAFEWNGYTCIGSRYPWEQPKLAILNSAQSKYPLGKDEWILGTLDALQTYQQAEITLITSLGMNTWEYTTWAGGTFGYPLIVAVLWDGRMDPNALFNRTIRDFSLSAEQVSLLLIPARKSRIKDSGSERDRLITSLADTLVPVSIHPHGRMRKLLENRANQTKADFRFSREWRGGRRRECYLFDIAAIRANFDEKLKGWLIHWTRACQGPWPRETSAEFYRNITENREEYAHSASKTLARIVNEKRIRANSWRIRGKEKVVCLSGLPPSKAVDLVRWRSRYVRYTIEPYGIGISSPAAWRIGIQKVRYLNERTGIPEGIPAFLLQGEGTSGDWPREDEFRHLGDIDLDALSPDEWEIIDLDGYRVF